MCFSGLVRWRMVFVLYCIDVVYCKPWSPTPGPWTSTVRDQAAEQQEQQLHLYLQLLPSTHIIT